MREALWGRVKPLPFDVTQPLYQALQQVSVVRASQPALRYGRQYFRPVSGNGQSFAISALSPGVIAYSRILNDQEVLVIANCGTSFVGQVIVDATLSPGSTIVKLLYSSLGVAAVAPGVVGNLPAGAVSIQEIDGSISTGPAVSLPVTLAAQEVQILLQLRG